MRIIGPEQYILSFDAEKFAVSRSIGPAKFSGLATSTLPKLYIVSVDRQPIYIGTTRQSMRTRFRMGFNATGESRLSNAFACPSIPSRAPTAVREER